ncbi:MAG: bifunctional glycosyltransferase family 2/GtrA family protein [Eggerthellaceae bacterium]|nr:bifunctional glycosyltransferase family 2/GtrA family protein [Eggerthellaceae bacterium]
MNTVVIIPTIDPDERILALVDQLKDRGFNRFIVVDDGSDASCDALFEALEQGGVRVLHHGTNLGKGAALKTAFAAVRNLFPEATHVVTVDGDGQHLPADVERVCRVADGHHDHVVLGVRDLQGKNVPAKSRIGNAFSSAYFKFDTGISCPDTQTGLRAFPTSLIPFALSVDGARYEYEMNFLTAVAKEDMPLAMVPIDTVYENGNAGSHFSPVRDSVRIYKQFLRFAGSSLSCSLVDLALFALISSVFNLGTAVLVTLATVIARVASGALNFTLNRAWSFSDAGSQNGAVRKQAMRYGVLFVAQMMASALLVTLLSWMPLPLVGVKVLVDGTLFFASYFIQRNWVFKKTRRSQAIIVKGGDYAKGAARKPIKAA